MKYLVLDPNGSGHHLEYVHHIHAFASSNDSDDEYIFILSSDFKKVWNLMRWQSSDNVEIQFVDNLEDVIKINNRIKKGYVLSKLLKSYIVKYNPDRVILIDLTLFMPALPFIVKNRRLINGIIYRIPLYKTLGFIRRTIDNFVFRLYGNSRCFNKVLLLNDERAPVIYNKLYRSRNFDYIPDPINLDLKKTPIGRENGRESKMRVVHAGGVGTRKGTFIILDAIKLMSEQESRMFDFAFVGSCSNSEERNKILYFINNTDENTRITFTDNYVSFEELISVISNSDIVLIPYLNVEQSSGILGYAAFFNKPVIGPADGLLGNIIKDYNLGYLLPSMTAESLKDTLLKISFREFNKLDSSRYVKTHTIECFTNKLIQ